MRRRCFIKSALFISLLACVQKPALSLAADVPTFDSPAAVVSAAEDAFVSRDFKAFADCFDPAGQEKMNEAAIQMLTVFISLTPDATAGKTAKAVFAKYGLTDLSKRGDESDDHFAERLARQLKDPHGFMVESTPLANPEPYHKKPAKGQLNGLKTDGAKAQASYVINLSAKNTMSQDLTFARTAGSWKIACAVFYPSPAE